MITKHSITQIVRNIRIQFDTIIDYEVKVLYCLENHTPHLNVAEKCCSQTWSAFSVARATQLTFLHITGIVPVPNSD